MLNGHLIAHTEPVALSANVVLYGDYRITVLSPSLFRIERNKNRHFCDEATQAVWFRNMQPVPYRFTSKKDRCLIKTNKVTLELRPKLSESTIIFPDGRKARINNRGNLLGTYRTLDCCEGNMSYWYTGDFNKREPIQLEPGVVSKTGVAVYDDSHSLLLKPDGKVAIREEKEADLYVFAYGHDYREAVKALFMITGKPPVIPRFALGNWWSRYHPYTQKEYLSLMASFADRNIPFTVATIDMDWHLVNNLPGGESGWTGYTWNQDLFPDYKACLRELHDMDMHITLNLHPALGVRHFETQYKEMAKRMGVDPKTKATIPFDITNDDFINAYFDVLHKPYEHDGVDFWWIDWQQGTNTAMDGLDPLWSLNHYHSLDIAKEKEQLVLSRYSGIGAHRYPLGFSGDTLITWNTMDYIPYFTATASNAGYSWWSHDIGGHMRGYKDDELFMRFIQFGVFSPINRLHVSCLQVMTKDPAFYKNGAGLIAAEFLRLRHAMIPFLYSAGCDTNELGTVLIEPMYYGWPEEKEAYRAGGQYMFGGQMIVAPITEKSRDGGWITKKVWLPEGQWTDVFTGDTYTGGGWKDMTRPMECFPLLAKEGGFFVLDGAPEQNGTQLPKTLKIMTFNGDGRYDLKEDAEGGRAVTSLVSERKAGGVQQLKIQCSDPDSILPARKLILEFRNVMNGNITVTADGQRIPFRTRAEQNFTVVTIEQTLPGVTYKVRVKELATASKKRLAAITRLASEAEGSYDTREYIVDSMMAGTEFLGGCNYRGEVNADGSVGAWYSPWGGSVYLKASSFALMDGRAHQIVLVGDGDRYSAYVDGVLGDSKALPIADGVQLIPGVLSLGGDPGKGNYIMRFRVFDKAGTDEELKALFAEYTPYGKAGRKPARSALTDSVLADVNFMKETVLDAKGALTFTGDTAGVFVDMKNFGYKGKGIDIDTTGVALSYTSPLTLGKHFTIEIMGKFAAGIGSKKRYEELVEASDLAPVFKRRLKEIEWENGGLDHGGI